MKKILSVLFMLTIVQLTANAGTYEVNYTNTGVPKSTGYHPSYGSNAAFTPENSARAGAVNRYIKHEDQYFDSLGNKTININMNSTNNASQTQTDNTQRLKRSFVKNKFKKVKTDTTTEE